MPSLLPLHPTRKACHPLQNVQNLVMLPTPISTATIQVTFTPNSPPILYPCPLSVRFYQSSLRAPLKCRPGDVSSLLKPSTAPISFRAERPSPRHAPQDLCDRARSSSDRPHFVQGLPRWPCPLSSSHTGSRSLERARHDPACRPGHLLSLCLECSSFVCPAGWLPLFLLKSHLPGRPPIDIGCMNE